MGDVSQAPGSEPRGHSRGDHLQECHQDPARAISLSDLEGPRPGSAKVDPVDLDAFLHGGATANSGAASAEVDQQECPAPVDVARAEAS